MSILPRWRGGKKRAPTNTLPPQGEAVSMARQEAETLVELANAAEDSGDLELALRRIREAIDIDPQFARAYLNLGNVLQAGHDLAGAISATARAILLNAKYPEAHFNLGRLHMLNGDAPAAESCFLRALELRPRFSAAAIAIANHYESTKRFPEAESWLRRVLSDEPQNPDATFGLCRLLFAQGKIGEVERALRRAVAANPRFVEGYCNLGDLCRSQRRNGEAIDWYLEAIAASDPDASPEIKLLVTKTTFVLATMLLKENRWEEGTAQLRRAIELMPESAAPYVNLAWMELRRARPREAIGYLEKAIELDPGEWTPRSFRLFALNLLDDLDPREIFAEHRQFGKWLESVTRRKTLVLTGRADPERALRVGYVSGDYRLHPVMQFILPMLEDHDRSRVQPFCYSNTIEPDDVTLEFQRRFAGMWRDITGLDDERVANLIVEDEIDILVDLSGHTGDSRLSVFAQKPAPVQVAWLGYLNTTGLQAIDHRLVDQYTDPVGVSEELHTEKLVRLPDSQWAYWPIFEVPVMREDRSRQPREILFGSFNQFTKLSDRALDLWGRVLATLPNARLRVAGLPPGNFEEYLLRRLEGVGIAPTRVDMVMRVPMMQYLRAFNDVDIALDTMPYNGATTTLDTLWMGVPVVGLVGGRSISRGTYSILKTLGLEELIAETPDQYVELNVRLATDPDWRNEFHSTLRERLRRSPLTDVSRFAESLEAAYRAIWREWCEAQERVGVR